MVGRRPKSAAPQQGEPVPTALPPAPAWLSPEAKEEWLRTGNRLLSAGLMTETDTTALTLYCESWSSWRHALAKVSEFGPIIKSKSGHLTPSPYVQVADKAMGQMLKILSGFKPAPAARCAPRPPVPRGSQRRPYKFTEERKGAYLDLLRQGGRRHASARAVGISPWTVVNRMNDDPKFAVAVEKAEMEANEVVENALYAAALSGNVVAIQVWLYNRTPERWKDKSAATAVAVAGAVSATDLQVARARAGAVSDDDFFRVIETAYAEETGEEAPTFDESQPDSEPPPALAPGPPPE